MDRHHGRTAPPDRPSPPGRGKLPAGRVGGSSSRSRQGRRRCCGSSRFQSFPIFGVAGRNGENNTAIPNARPIFSQLMAQGDRPRADRDWLESRPDGTSFGRRWGGVICYPSSKASDVWGAGSHHRATLAVHRDFSRDYYRRLWIAFASSETAAEEGAGNADNRQSLKARHRITRPSKTRHPYGSGGGSRAAGVRRGP
jgi:hypothetical protein